MMVMSICKRRLWNDPADRRHDDRQPDRVLVGLWVATGGLLDGVDDMTERSDTSPELDEAPRGLMKPSIIDTSRQGGEGTGPKRMLGHEPMSVEDAEEHVERILGWRTVLGASNQASLALLREVKRLRVVVSELEAGYQNLMELCLTYHGQRDRANEELVRFRAALLELR